MASIVMGGSELCGRIREAARPAPREYTDAVPVAAVVPYVALSRVQGATARPNLRPRPVGRGVGRRLSLRRRRWTGIMAS